MQTERASKTKKKFYRDLKIYFAVNALLIVLDLSDGGGIWFVWPLVGWGIYMIFQASKVYALDDEADSN